MPETKARWFSYQKGGKFRKWFGNLEYLVNWEQDGFMIKNFKDVKTGKIRSHNYNLDYIFKTGVTWNALTSGKTSARKRKVFFLIMQDPHFFQLSVQIWK